MLIIVPSAILPHVCCGPSTFPNHSMDRPTWFGGLVFAFHWYPENPLPSSEAAALIVHIFVKLFLLGGGEVRRWILDSCFWVTAAVWQFNSLSLSQPPYGSQRDANLSFTFLSSCFVRRKHAKDTLSCRLPILRDGQWTCMYYCFTHCFFLPLLWQRQEGDRGWHATQGCVCDYWQSLLTLNAAYPTRWDMGRPTDLLLSILHLMPAYIAVVIPLSQWGEMNAV